MELGELIRKTHTLVSLPEVFYRAQELLDDPNYDTGTLAKVLESDTGLTARLLRFVNSSLYGLSHRVDRVTYAVTLVGRNTLRDLILATAVTRAFGKISTKLVDMSTFWHHSIYCGLIARQLGKRCGVLHDERMLIAGLVHDVGQLILYQLLPVQSASALSLAEPSDNGLFRAERIVFGYSHAEVGAELLKHWKLPESLQEVVRYHHEPERAERYAMEAAIVHLANSIANRLEPSRNIINCEPEIHPGIWATIGLADEISDPTLSEANEQFLETLDLLLPSKAVL